jgi:phytoene dehydrogenase-like protein
MFMVETEKGRRYRDKLWEIILLAFDNAALRLEIMSFLEAYALGGEAYGVANCIGQAGAQRPSPISPIQNLYYMGNDAGGFGLGTQQAVDSAVNVVNIILDRQSLS